jgi:hypothetical protein
VEPFPSVTTRCGPASAWIKSMDLVDQIVRKVLNSPDCQFPALFPPLLLSVCKRLYHLIQPTARGKCPQTRLNPLPRPFPRPLPRPRRPRRPRSPRRPSECIARLALAFSTGRGTTRRVGQNGIQPLESSRAGKEFLPTGAAKIGVDLGSRQTDDL